MDTRSELQVLRALVSAHANFLFELEFLVDYPDCLTDYIKFHDDRINKLKSRIDTLSKKDGLL